MNENRRPVAVTVVGWLYLLAGAAGLIGHARGLWAGGRIATDMVAAEATEALAVLAGFYLLRGRDWARWLALGWIAFHVAISLQDPLKLAAHSVFLAGIAWGLLQRPASEYFRAGRRSN